LLVHPVIAESYATALGCTTSRVSAASDLPFVALQGADLLQRFASVSDERPGQGRDHLIAVVLTLCVAAVLAGMRSFTAIAGWDAELLIGLYRTTPRGPHVPVEDDVVAGTDPALTRPQWTSRSGAWLTARANGHRDAAGQRASDESALVAVAVDGKGVQRAGPNASRFGSWQQV
jgi:hypothetical protein